MNIIRQYRIRKLIGMNCTREPLLCLKKRTANIMYFVALISVLSKPDYERWMCFSLSQISSSINDTCTAIRLLDFDSHVVTIVHRVSFRQMGVVMCL